MCTALIHRDVLLTHNNNINAASVALRAAAEAAATAIKICVFMYAR